MTLNSTQIQRPSEVEAAEFIPNFRLKLIFATVCNNRGIKFRDEKIEPIFHFFSNFGHLLATIS